MISAANFEPNPLNEVLGPTSSTKRPKTAKTEISGARTPRAQTHIAEINADKFWSSQKEEARSATKGATGSDLTEDQRQAGKGSASGMNATEGDHHKSSSWSKPMVKGD